MKNPHDRITDLRLGLVTIRDNLPTPCLGIRVYACDHQMCQASRIARNALMTDEKATRD